MNSISTATPIRVAATLPKHYVQFTVRTYTRGIATTGLRCSGSYFSSNYTHQPATKRLIHSTPKSQIKEYFPPPDAPKIKEVKSAWVHPVYVETSLPQWRRHKR
jgi:hypothetical protein